MTPEEWYEQQARACGCDKPEEHRDPAAFADTMTPEQYVEAYLAGDVRIRDFHRVARANPVIVAAYEKASR